MEDRRMKLAEALVLRADMQARMTDLVVRARRNARHQEGQEPAEDPVALLAEYDRILVEQEDLIVRINARNLATEVEDGLTITAAIARRDRLRRQHGVHNELANVGSTDHAVLTRSEVRWVSAVDVRALRAEADDLARQLRELDTRIQQINWTTDL
jgi:hypothetical protein